MLQQYIRRDTHPLIHTPTNFTDHFTGSCWAMMNYGFHLLFPYVSIVSLSRSPPRHSKIMAILPHTEFTDLSWLFLIMTLEHYSNLNGLMFFRNIVWLKLRHHTTKLYAERRATKRMTWHQSFLIFFFIHTYVYVYTAINPYAPLCLYIYIFG